MSTEPLKISAGSEVPGIGVYFKAQDVPAMRGKIQQPPCDVIYRKMLAATDKTMAEWVADRPMIAAYAAGIPDFPRKGYGVPRKLVPNEDFKPGEKFQWYVEAVAPQAAFIYLMSGDKKYATFAWEVFEEAAKVPRWGWFPWDGAHIPQIAFGTYSRTQIFVLDSIWGTLSEEQRQMGRKVIAEKVVEPYYRVVLHTPGMGLSHMRSKNQGNNALSAALIGSAFLGESYPENKVWFNSLLQTYHWIITHDIGWMGQGLESDMGGYWTVSMQNLYTAAVALYNTTGIDLRCHPGFEQATYFPLIHEVTVPPVSKAGMNPDVNMGVLSGKPIEVPEGRSPVISGPWWFDYAVHFPDTPALYFLNKGMVVGNRLVFNSGHQGGLADVLAIAWYDPTLQAQAKQPTALSLFTDRMANIRNGYGLGYTCLYFDGDFFLSAKKEILCATSGKAWHFPWHQYQITETGIETEGENFAPSMVIKDTYDDPNFAWFHCVSGVSNVSYYPHEGQLSSYRQYDKRERSVFYSRASQGTPDYFVFVDTVRHKDAAPRWYAWTWHILNSASDKGNFGKYVPQGDNAVLVQRPSADMWIQFITPGKLAFEQAGIPSQLNGYEMDHNAQMLRAIAGGYEPAPRAKPVVIPVTAWGELGAVVKDGSLYMETPPTQKVVASSVVSGVTGGTRYRVSLKSKKQDYRVYEATAYNVTLEFLDADGNVVAKPTENFGSPDSLRLEAPMSNTPTHDWAETVHYVDVPAGAVAVRGAFFAIGGAHEFKLGKLWLGPVEMQPLGTPAREREQQFVAVVMPLDKNAAKPAIESGKDGSFVIRHANGMVDNITVAADGKMTLERRNAQAVVASFPAKGSAQAASALKTNSEASAKALQAGLKPVLDQINAQRDVMTKAGRTNLAIGAKVTASAQRDERFAASHIVDNEAAEYPTDGHLDYQQGNVTSSDRLAGYGSKDTTESLTKEPTVWPLYVKPTYWLLPQSQLGWVEVELSAPAAVDLVRLLNTSNAGLNDYAAHQFKVELYDANRTLLASQEGQFGKVYDQPFKQAFVRPDWFSKYAPAFAGMLEPGVTVPFGDGWKDVTFTGVKNVKYVRFVITKYWGIGGGLNELQVYGN